MKRPLERIGVDWNRVNPLYFNKIDQNHVIGGSPMAISPDHDLV
jgi:hypothetical protein